MPQSLPNKNSKFSLNKIFKQLNKNIMSLQIIRGGNGKPTGVFIPMSDWEIMKDEYQNLQAWEEPEPTKEDILAGIKEAVEEVKLIKAGKMKAKSLKELLNEL